MTSKIKVDNINKVSDDSNIINKCGTTITLGASGDTINLASGASQSGFGRSGSVNWQTTPKTATFTAADGEGYFINSGSAITANLPAGSAGAIVAFSDYARNFATYNLTISPNGSEKIGGVAQDAKLNVNGQAATFVYVDATKGWVNVQNAEDTETGQVEFMSATGGTITTSGDFKIHTFTGPGTFCVAATSDVCATRNKVDYLVIAGGGSGQASAPNAGGGGAGGYRESPGSATGCYSVSPRGAAPAVALTVTATAFPITVGAGGANLANGGLSTFSSITSAGGGYGAGQQPTPSENGNPGGSGGGGSNGGGSAGSGNQPPVNPVQGTNGGAGNLSGPGFGGGGGGGAIIAGSAGSGSAATGAGGGGATSSINGTPTTRAGGGGGENNASPAPGGAGGGGASGVAGTANTGGGGGGNALGGSGVVILRYKFQ
jgi:hypothetical protein